MKSVGGVRIRFARDRDIRWCMRHDYEAKLATRMKYKIALNEIILAEFGGRIVGYLRLEYLWMKIPYIGLVLVLAKPWLVDSRALH